jgi:alkylhydroperoxidase/carboxymuconolactone decarboxylase family protein YurZ
MDRRERGIAVYGGQFGVPEEEAERRLVERFGRRFAEDAFSAAGGSTWEDGPLTRRERSLVVLALLAALGGVEARLRTHVRFALENGATPDELDAAVCLVATYAGFARASVAMEVVRDELADLGVPLPDRAPA